MRTYKAYIEMYRWDIMLIFTNGNYRDRKPILDLLNKINANSEQINDILQDVRPTSHDGGLHLHNNSLRKSIIIINRYSTKELGFETVSHELSHCIDSILRTCYIDDKEADAYLFGYVFFKFYAAFKLFF